MTTRTLIAQNSAKRTPQGVTFTYSLYRTGSQYDVVLHTRTHEGVRVKDKWDSKPILIEADTDDDAVQQARKMTITYMKSLIGEQP